MNFLSASDVSVAAHPGGFKPPASTACAERGPKLLPACGTPGLAAGVCVFEVGFEGRQGGFKAGLVAGGVPVHVAAREVVGGGGLVVGGGHAGGGVDANEARRRSPTGTCHNILTRTCCQNAAYTSYPPIGR